MKSIKEVFILSSIFCLIIFFNTGEQLQAENNQGNVTKLFESKINNDDYDLIFKEVKRTANTSTVHFYANKGKSVGSIIFIACSSSELAKIRGFRYFIPVEERFAEEGYAVMMLGFLSENTPTSLQDLLGSDYQDYKDKIMDAVYYEENCMKEGL